MIVYGLFLPVSKSIIMMSWNAGLWRNAVNADLLEILVCPLCKGKLQYDKDKQELICRADRLAYPIRDGIPIMWEDQARVLDDMPGKY